MTEDSFKSFVDAASRAIDATGVIVLIVGLVYATAQFARAVMSRKADDRAYNTYRQRAGRTILLALEFLVAADIIRTVAVTPTFRGVGVLAIIVLVRTFLSFTLEVELEGRWPWQRARQQNPGPQQNPRPARARD
jgi:uncharacterized membrane protein